MTGIDWAERNKRSGPSRYGERYWAIGLPDGTRIYLFADRIDVTPSGALLAFREGSVVSDVNVAFPPGAWQYVYAASMLDGGPVAASDWPGLTERESYR